MKEAKKIVSLNCVLLVTPSRKANTNGRECVCSNKDKFFLRLAYLMVLFAGVCLFGH